MLKKSALPRHMDVRPLNKARMDVFSVALVRNLVFDVIAGSVRLWALPVWPARLAHPRSLATAS
jgi:hypothetical protein